jgi:hypothetical protein
MVLMVKLASSELVVKRGLSMPSKDAPNPTAVEGQNVPACHHHWIIEPAHGSVSRGVCQVCEEVREFKNSIEWEYGGRKPGRPAST